jgi:hypothetical protein
VSGAQLWAENYDRPADTDIFQLQDDISKRIVATVADANGVMLRSMAATLRQRPIEEHTVGGRRAGAPLSRVPGAFRSG